MRGTRSRIVGSFWGPKFETQSSLARRRQLRFSRHVSRRSSQAPPLQSRLHFTPGGDGVLTADHNKRSRRDNASPDAELHNKHFRKLGETPGSPTKRNEAPGNPKKPPEALMSPKRPQGGHKRSQGGLRSPKKSQEAPRRPREAQEAPENPWSPQEAPEAPKKPRRAQT